MKKTENISNIRKFFRLIYLKLFQINDTPRRIALGVGLGVFTGIIPGAGPIAALFLAFIFRVNRASALLGSLITNTWLSLVTFFLSIKIGSAIFGMNWQAAYNNWILFFKDFRWIKLFKLSIFKIILPVMLGYFIVAFFLGFLVYLTTLIVLNKFKHNEA